MRRAQDLREHMVKVSGPAACVQKSEQPVWEMRQPRACFSWALDRQLRAFFSRDALIQSVDVPEVHYYSYLRPLHAW